jgi:hypothetical protein
MTRRRAQLAAIALIGGCASWGGVPDDELPAQSIAIYYRTPEEVRVRAEAARRAGPEPRAVSADAPTVVGSKAHLRADADAIGRYLESMFGTDAGVPETHLGRLALLDPRSGDLAFIEGAMRGAVPQAWSRDRGALLFVQPTTPGGRDAQIFEWSAADRTVRRVTVGPPVHSQACYGPGGRTVVTAVEFADRAASRIRISQPGGRAPFEDLSPGPADHSPTCAPDGSAVAFTRSSDGADRIWLAAAPFDAAPRRLTPGRAPRFADTGGWIVYTAVSGREERLFRIRSDGSGRAPIGSAGGGEGWPTASPDGRLVAYVASVASGSRLLVRRFDGSGDRILLASGESEHPVW